MFGDDALVTLANRVQAALQPIAADEYALNLQTSTGLSVRAGATREFAAASLIKLGVAAYIEELVERNPQFMQTQLTVPDNPVAGAGVTYHLSVHKWAVADLLDLMLTVSDNTATNMLLKACGGLEPVSEWLTRNYPGATLRRRLMQPTDNLRPNTITADTARALLHHFFDADTQYTRFIRTCLANQNNRGKMVALADEDDDCLQTFNKTGELATSEHDAARFATQSEWTECVMLTHFAPGRRQVALIALQNVGGAIVDYLERDFARPINESHS